MTTRILATVALERVRQHIKHGDQRHLPDGTGPLWTETADVARRDCDRALADGTLTYRHILTYHPDGGGCIAHVCRGCETPA